MYTARPYPGPRHPRRLLAIPLVLLVALSTIVPAIADDSQPGWLTVSVTPDVNATVAVDGVARNTGAIHQLELPPGEVRVSFGHVDGYLAPSASTIEIRSNDTAHLEVEYEEAGVLDVAVTPDGIEPSITVNGVVRDVGATTVPVPIGAANVCGGPISGYQTPSCQEVEVAPGQTSSVTLAYEGVPDDDPVVVDGRVSDGLVALYDFSDGSGSTISDTAGVLDGMDLTIDNTSATTWGDGTLTLDSPTLATTAGAPTALYEQIRDTGEFTIEAWIEPDNLTQNGPARILSLGKDGGESNFVLGQGRYLGASDLIEVRHQRAGDYKLPTSPGTLDTDLTHVAATHTTDGTVTIYIDGQEHASRTMEGDPANWDLTHKLGLGAELNGDRPWLGTYHLTAIYNTALTPDQITTNHTAGPGSDTHEPVVEEPVADGRVSEGLVALYDFADGAGDTIADSAGVLDGMDLTIADTSATTWSEGSLTLNSPTIATTTNAPTALYQQIRATGEFTIETWIEAANLTQTGPARILSLGNTTSDANFVLGQGSWQGSGDLIEARHQRAGDYTLPTDRGTLDTTLTHVAATHTDDGTVTIYIDGQEHTKRTMEGNPTNWDLTHRLGIGAELNGDRPWLGTYHLTAIYNTALTPDQITTNHTAGPGSDTDTTAPTPEPKPEPEPDQADESDNPPSPGSGTPLGTTSVLSQHGITWTFSDAHEYGTYANGDYWVIGPVQIEEITPRSVSGDRHMHGSMINPSPEQGSGVGYDSDIRDVWYRASRNVALDVSSANPLAVDIDSSLVSTISVPEANSRPGVDTAAVLTVVGDAPPNGSFRPPYSGKDKTAHFNVDQLDVSSLPRLPHVAGTPDPARLARDFERVWLDHVPGWTGRSIHPQSNMPDYGRLLTASLGRGYLTLMLDFPTAEKEELLVNLTQIGIDFYGIVEDGGERNWVPNGGHAQGRKLPILFAGTVLDDAAMASIGDRSDVFFGEDAQTFYVNDSTLRNGKGYDESHLGMPEWGIRHATDPSRDTIDWNAPYRRDGTANSWHSHVLVARILGLQSAWNHDALFDYTDRYMEREEAGHWFRSWDRPFSEAMWDTYRQDF